MAQTLSTGHAQAGDTEVGLVPAFSDLEVQKFLVLDAASPRPSNFLQCVASPGPLRGQRRLDVAGSISLPRKASSSDY